MTGAVWVFKFDTGMDYLLRHTRCLWNTWEVKFNPPFPGGRGTMSYDMYWRSAESKYKIYREIQFPAN